MSPPLLREAALRAASRDKGINRLRGVMAYYSTFAPICFTTLLHFADSVAI
jgi:hypothetical protein